MLPLASSLWIWVTLGALGVVGVGCLAVIAFVLWAARGFAHPTNHDTPQAAAQPAAAPKAGA